MFRYLNGLIISFMTVAAISCSKPFLHTKAAALRLLKKPSSVGKNKTGSSVQNTHKSDSVSNAAMIDPVLVDVSVAAAATVDISDAAPVKIIRLIKAPMSREVLLKNLQDLATHDPTAKTMQAISQLLQTKTGHRNFVNPINNGNFKESSFWGEREWGFKDSCYQMQLLNKTLEGRQEIAADVNLRKAVNKQEFNVYNYNYQSYQTNADAPMVSGDFYGIQDTVKNTIELLGFLRIAVKPDGQEYIYLYFGERNGMAGGNTIYKNPVVVHAHNVPLQGKFSVQYANTRIKTYDFEHLSNDDKVALKELRIFSDIQ